MTFLVALMMGGLAAPVVPVPPLVPVAAPMITSSAAADAAEESPYPHDPIEPVDVQLDRIAAMPVMALDAPMMQVRYEQRIIVRIPRRSVTSPVSSAVPTSRRDPAVLPRKWTERKAGKCLLVNQIAGVQITADNRLLLFLRDRRVMRAELEKSCQASSFYSGFYVERSKDGKLCVDRDMLHARSGAKCEMERLREVVPAN